MANLSKAQAVKFLFAGGYRENRDQIFDKLEELGRFRSDMEGNYRPADLDSVLRNCGVEIGRLNTEIATAKQTKQKAIDDEVNQRVRELAADMVKLDRVKSRKAAIAALLREQAALEAGE